jgi:hypothetical protein
MNKKDVKSRLTRWVLLLQEFHLHIVDRKGEENPTADYLSRMEITSDDHITIDDSLCNEQLASIRVTTPWFVDYANFIIAKFMPPWINLQQRKKFFYEFR